MKLIDTFLGILVAFLWGSNFVAIKFYTESLPVLYSTSFRLISVFVLCLPWLIIPKNSWLKLYKISLYYCLGFIGAGCLSIVFGGNITTLVILSQFSVPIAAIIAKFEYNEEITKRKLYGIIIAILGSILVVGGQDMEGNALSIILVLIASTFFAIYSVKIKSLNNLSPINILGWNCLIGGFNLLALAIIFEDLPQYKDFTTKAVFFLIYSTLGPTIAGFGIWTFLLSKYPVNTVAPFYLLVPFFGTISTIFALNEEISSKIILGGIIIVIGVSIIQINIKKHFKFIKF